LALEADPRDGSRVVWRSQSTGHPLGRFDIDHVPRFVWELPDGPATERLAAIVEMRALLPLVTMKSKVTVLRHLDGDGKTVARLIVDETTVGNGPSLAPRIEVVPLRGYEREARWLSELLSAQVTLVPVDDDIASAGLRAAGHEPGGYSSKLALSLDGSSTAREAWLAVLRSLFAAMQINEAGVRDDIDSEFLHDFRVAIRRTRSVLGQARGVLDAAGVRRFRDDFAWLGGATGPTRDFDVYLLTVPELQQTLPVERREDLKPFFAFLEQHQRRAHAALVEQLDSDRYSTFLRDWRAFLDGSPDVASDDVSDAARPAPDVAAERTWAAFRRLIRRGRLIDEQSEPEALHDLRKDAKKLRYLLECFGSLFPEGELGHVVKQLKQLQEVLGEYQDCEIQAEALERMGQEMIHETGANAATLMAMGSIVEQLGNRQQRARAAYAERFARFDTRSVRTPMREALQVDRRSAVR
jgi:CHAD domain-containing protein